MRNKERGREEEEEAMTLETEKILLFALCSFVIILRFQFPSVLFDSFLIFIMDFRPIAELGNTFKKKKR